MAIASDRLPIPRGRLALLLLIALVPIVALWSLGPIPQDPAYHRFADARTLLGVPNFWNVASNLPFLLFGAWGAVRVLRGPLDPLARAQRPAWFVLFAGAALVGLGSSWYHLQPGNLALVWDRLPMTLAFMGLFAMLLGEHLDLRLGRATLWPLLALGLASVLLWYAGERRGHGDLRLYAMVQFVPVLLIPALLLLFPRPHPARGLLWAVLGTYVLAKGLEHFDAPLFALLRVTGGHAVKHLAAAAGIGLLLRWLVVRARAAT